MKPIRELLEAVAAGEISVEKAQSQLSAREIQAIDGATIDAGRAARCGFGEVVYGEGKSAELISEIVARSLVENTEVLVTRLSQECFDQIELPNVQIRYSASARCMRAHLSQAPPAPDMIMNCDCPPIAVVTAGSTDQSVADESAETLAWMRVPTRRLTDVGVAGPQRLLAKLSDLDGCAAAVVVAGMEGALTSVLAGHVAFPVIGVPTSVGYGASMGGVTALLSMVTSCTANVAVVNIDAGFKGGYIAGLIAHNSRVSNGTSTG